MNKRTKTILSLVALVAVVAVFVGVYLATRPETVAGEKHITVELVGKDSSRTVELDTDEEYLGPALQSEGLIDGTQSEFGLYITTVDGYTADESAQEWWCLTKGGEMWNYGADATELSDGDTYELTFTVGY